MISTVAGLEPAIPRSEVWCLIHQATRPHLIRFDRSTNKSSKIAKCVANKRHLAKKTTFWPIANCMRFCQQDKQQKYNTKRFNLTCNTNGTNETICDRLDCLSDMLAAFMYSICTLLMGCVTLCFYTLFKNVESLRTNSCTGIALIANTQHVPSTSEQDTTEPISLVTQQLIL